MRKLLEKLTKITVTLLVAFNTAFPSGTAVYAEEAGNAVENAAAVGDSVVSEEGDDVLEITEEAPEEISEEVSEAEIPAKETEHTESSVISEEIPAEVSDNSSDDDIEAIAPQGANDASIVEDAITENDGIALIATSTTKSVKCYLDIDGSFTEVGEITTAYLGYNWANRPYVTATQLEEIYGKYGFAVDDLDDSKYLFPNTVPTDGNQIWADQPAKADGDDYKVAIAGSSNYTTYMYYLPNNKSGSSSYFTSRKSITDSTMLSENAFWSVSVVDATGTYTDLPETQYILTGNGFEVTLPNTSDYVWTAVNTKTGNSVLDTLTATDNGDGTVTYKGTATSPIKFMTKVDGVIVSYNADLKGQVVDLGHYAVSASNQTISLNGSIDGNTTASYVVKSSEDTYTFAYPDNDYAMTSTNSSYQKYYYNFMGWKIGSNTYQPGDTITVAELDALAATDGTVAATAVWIPFDSGFNTKRIVTCNFFVQLNSEIADSSGSASSTPKTNYSNSVYVSRVSHTGEITNSGNFTLIEGESGENAYAVNNTIRSLDQTSYGDYELLFESIPSDEEVLASIRNDITNNGKKVYVENTVVPASDVTTKNFTVRWYVVKYDTGDGWHIDGILVTKAPKFAVKKTFNGEADIVDSVKANYSISVSHDGTTDHTLNLNAKTGTNTDGYDYYDAESDTYYWIVNGITDKTYSVRENNYTYTGSTKNIVSTYQYRITNTEDSTYEWLDYSNTGTTGITITPETYESDVSYLAYKTAELNNTYIKKSTLVIHKTGDVNSDTMKGVKFTLSSDGQSTGSNDFNLYQKTGTAHYSFVQNSEYTEKSDGQVLVTDGNGNIYLHLPETTQETTYTYDLIETIPTGYSGAYGFRIVVKNDGEIISVNEIDKNGNTVPNSKWVTYGDTIEIKNSTAVFTQATVKKQWNVAKESDMLPVTVELWRNGAKIPGTQYTQTLSAENNWQYSWENLPVYMNGELAEYTVKEIQIGDTYYSSEYDDGYKYYVVTHADNVYWQSGDEENVKTTPVWQDEDGDNVFADNMLLTVENMPDTASVVFSKTDTDGKALAGAVFGLYSDEECTKEVMRATSASTGTVAFTDIKNGTYYVKEISAPEGYGIIYDEEGNAPVYKAVIKNKKTTFTDSDGNVVTAIQNQKLGNLVITKKVAGNMGDKEEQFTATVTIEENETPLSGGVANGQVTVSGGGNDITLTKDDFVDGKATVEITIKHGDPVTISGLTYGTSYSVEENNPEDSGYTVTYENEIGIINKASTDVVITNTRNMAIPTESTADNLFARMAGYLVALFGFLIAIAVIRKQQRDVKN